MKIINKPWFAILTPAAIGHACVSLCVLWFLDYGWSLFLILPVLVGFLSAFFTTLGKPASLVRVILTTTASILLLGVLLLSFAVEGMICLIMAMPLAGGLAYIGAALGWLVGKACNRNFQAIIPLVLIALFPCVAAMESHERPAHSVRSVTTSVVIAAPIDRVWSVVVAFPPIQASPEPIFQWGIACPMEARIDGNGVGAIRRCIFDTGSFVEPITTWSQPNLLAFDVVSNPPPMREFSPFGNLDTAHLHNYMTSRHGQFKLTQAGDRVILEGTTWYSHTLEPQWYWGPISDHIIHRIHNRVLQHIRTVAESRDNPTFARQPPTAGAISDHENIR